MLANRLILISIYKLAVLASRQRIRFEVIFFDGCWATGFANMDYSAITNQSVFLTYKVQEQL